MSNYMDDEIYDDDDMSSQHSDMYHSEDYEYSDEALDQDEPGLLGLAHGALAGNDAEGGPATGNDEGNTFRGPQGHMSPEETTMYLLRTLEAARGMRIPRFEFQGFGGGSRVHQMIQQLRDRSNPTAVIYGLETLNELLLNSREDTMMLFPVQVVASELVDLLRQPGSSPDILVMAARSITQLIDLGLQNIIQVLVDAGIINALSVRFEDIGYIDVAEQAVSILERVAAEFPGPVLESGSPVTLLQFIDFFNQHIQKAILGVVGVCASAISPNNVEQAKLMVPILENHLDGDNPKLNEMAIGGMCQIIHALAKRTTEPSAELGSTISANVRRLLIARISPESALLPKLFRALSDLAHHQPEFAQSMLNENVVAIVGHALTKGDLNEVPSEEVLSTLLHRPKDALSNAVRLFGVMLPLPKSPFSFHGPYRRGTTEGGPTLDVDGIEDSALRTYAIVAGTTSMLIYSSSADLGVRQLVLLVLLQIASSLSADVLETLTDKLDLVSFASNVISQADAKSLTIGGLDLALELINKVPHIYLEQFARLGLHSEVAALATTTEPKGHYSLSGELAPVEGFLAAKIVEIYQKSDASLEKDTTKSREMLQRFVAGEPGTWTEVAELVKDSTTLELLTLGVFDAMTQVLGESDVSGFLEAFNGDLFNTLLAKLGDALSRSERFGVISSFSGNVPSLFHALTRHVRIKLNERNSTRSWPLTVHGIAAIENLEEFCLSRLAFAQLLSTDENLFGALSRHDDDDNRQGSRSPPIRAGREADRFSFEGTAAPAHNDEDDDEISDGSGDTETGDVNSREQTPDDRDNADGTAELVEVENDDAPEGGVGATISETSGSAASGPSIKFYFQNELLDSDMSIISAIYRSLPKVEGDSVLPRSLWTDEFTITFEKSAEPAPKRGDLHFDNLLDTFRAVPPSFGESPYLAGTMKLMSILYALNTTHPFVRPAAFTNSKLTAKLNRQLEDPLVVVSSILPQWTVDTVRLYPFLYPFETRYLFVQSTSFGYSRSMARWQQSEDSEGHTHRFAFGRTVRQKYRVSRSSLLPSALKVLQMSSGMPAVIEVEFYGEEGTGLGPTLEFYANVSREFQLVSNRMWRMGSDVDGYVYDPNGLFPAPMDKKDTEVLKLFNGMGKFVARAMLDQRIIDFRLNPAFFTVALDLPYDEQALLQQVDPAFHKALESLKHSNVDELGIDFTLPGTDIELIPNGSNIPVTNEKLDEYIELVIDWTLHRGVHRQIIAFKKGFAESMPFEALHAFTAPELTVITGRAVEDWSEGTLLGALKADHGYTMNSEPVLNLISIMSKLDENQRREFLQFMTGSPNLPIGGFKALYPPFTVVFKHPENESLSKDAYLPSVMTCANYLKLPEYSSKEIMQKQLWKAIEGGSGAFPLS